MRPYDSRLGQLQRAFWRGLGYRLARGAMEVPGLLVYALGAWVLYRYRVEVSGWVAHFVQFGPR